MRDVANARRLTKEWKEKNRERYRAMSRAWYAKLSPEKLAHYRARHRRLRGLPAPPYPETQCCELCGKDKGDKSLHLDHDHSTGAFRGWLCGKCNRGIGWLNDDPELMRKAALYVETRKAIDQ